MSICENITEFTITGVVFTQQGKICLLYTSVSSMKKLSATNLLAPGGIIVLQQAMDEQFVDTYGILKSRKTYKYGDTRITTYVAKDVDDKCNDPEAEDL